MRHFIKFFFFALFCSISQAKQVLIKDAETPHELFIKQVQKSSGIISFVDHQIESIKLIEVSSQSLSNCLVTTEDRQLKNCWRTLDSLLQNPLNETNRLLLSELVEKMLDLQYSPKEISFLQKLKSGLGIENEFYESHKASRLDQRYFAQKIKEAFPNEKITLLINGQEFIDIQETNTLELSSTAIYQFVILTDSYPPLLKIGTWKEFLKQDLKPNTSSNLGCKLIDRDEDIQSKSLLKFRYLKINNWSLFRKRALDQKSEINKCYEQESVKNSELQQMLNQSNSSSESPNLDSKKKWAVSGVAIGVAAIIFLKDKQIVLGW